MRWKYDRHDPEEYRCCFCFHVRTGTLLLGLLNLVCLAIGFTWLMIGMVHPDMIDIGPTEYEMSSGTSPIMNIQLAPQSINNIKPASESINNIQPSFQSINNIQPASVGGILTVGQNDSHLTMHLKATHENIHNWVRMKNWNFESMMSAMLLTIIFMVIAACLVYGTIKGIAKYITPFFCVQMVDFCLSGLTMLSYFSNLNAVRRWIATQSILPFKDQLLNLDNDHLTLLTLIVFVGVLAVKGYFIGVVWSCYKYLKLNELTIHQNNRAHMYDTEEIIAVDDTQLLLPPKYEDVLLMPATHNGPAPPPYASSQ